MKLGVPYDSTEYIQDAINEVLHTLVETLLIVVVVIFLFLGSFRSVLIPVIAIPISLIGAVFLMLCGWLHHQPSDSACHCAFGRIGRRRRHCHGGERRAASAYGQDSISGREGRRARTGRTNYRNDDHSGSGLCPHRNSRRANRGAVPRVRVYSGRGCRCFWCCGADLLADDGFEVVACR